MKNKDKIGTKMYWNLFENLLKLFYYGLERNNDKNLTFD